MKKLLFIIPVAILFIHLSYQLDGPNAWTQQISGAGPIWSLAVDPTNTNIIYVASNTAGIWKTTNGGTTMTINNTGITNLTMNFVALATSSPGTLYCGGGSATAGNGMYKSTDAAGTWTAINNGITQTLNTVQSISVDPTNPNTVVIAVWDGGTTNATAGVYKTTDGGANWAPSNSGMGANKNILCLARNPLNPNTMYAGSSFLQPNPPGTGPCFVYKSYNGGNTWTNMSTGLPSQATDIDPIRYIDVSRNDSNLVIVGMFYNTANMDAGVYVSTNGGTSWVMRNSGIPNAQGTLIRSVLIRPGTTTEFYAGVVATGLGGVYRTTNAGVSWTNFSAAPLSTASVVRQMYFRTAGSSDSTLMACNAGTVPTDMGVFAYTFVPLGINDPNYTPKEFSLMQNYPNPFNPETKIVYQIPHQSYVNLSVYDAAGKLVKVLVDGNQSQLVNTVEFNAENLSTGVYFYRLTAGDFTSVKKMILVK
jgi:type IX secretion system substrate protein